MIDEQSSMQEVVAGLKRADYAACYEFCRRQSPEVLEPLAVGADRLGDIAFELQCRQPETLLAWKFPDAFESFEQLPAALDAACEGREGDLYPMLADAPFWALAATASACSYIKITVTQRLNPVVVRSATAP